MTTYSLIDKNCLFWSFFFLHILHIISIYSRDSNVFKSFFIIFFEDYFSRVNENLANNNNVFEDPALSHITYSGCIPLFWLRGLFVIGYRLRTVWWRVTSFLMTLNFAWLTVVDWKQRTTCSFLSSFSTLCGAWLGLGLVYHQLIQIPFGIILFSLFILLEDCELVVHSCSLFGYVAFGLCGMSGITEFSRLRKT